jgi:integrase
VHYLSSEPLETIQELVAIQEFGYFFVVGATERRRVERGIYQRGRGVLDVVVSTGLGADGRYGQRSETVRGTIRDARRARARLTTTTEARPARKPRASVIEKMTMGELFERFIASKVDLAPRTVDLYQSLWDQHCAALLAQVPVAELSAWHLDETYRLARTRLNATSTRKLHKLLNAVLVQGMRWELVSRNVAVLASPPREVKPEISPPSLNDYAKIVRAADRYQASFATLVRLAAVTGLRRGELCGLRFDDFDAATGSLAVKRQIVINDGKLVVSRTKTKSTRVVPLDAATCRLLEQHRLDAEASAEDLGVALRGTAYLFSTMPGNESPLRPDGVTARFAKVAHLAGVRCRFHDLRHLCGTQMIAAGVDAKTVADRLGHSTPVVTLAFYTHTVSETQRQAADVIGSVISGV